jgi:hypothetical protein
MKYSQRVVARKHRIKAKKMKEKIVAAKATEAKTR